MNKARQYLKEAWWLVTVLTVMIAATVLNMNCTGDGLRDALDPRTNQ